jgi:hypothetical protein
LFSGLLSGFVSGLLLGGNVEVAYDVVVGSAPDVVDGSFLEEVTTSVRVFTFFPPLPTTRPVTAAELCGWNPEPAILGPPNIFTIQSNQLPLVPSPNLGITPPSLNL